MKQLARFVSGSLACTLAVCAGAQSGANLTVYCEDLNSQVVYWDLNLGQLSVARDGGSTGDVLTQNTFTLYDADFNPVVWTFTGDRPSTLSTIGGNTPNSATSYIMSTADNALGIHEFKVNNSLQITDPNFLPIGDIAAFPHSGGGNLNTTATARAFTGHLIKDHDESKTPRIRVNLIDSPLGTSGPHSLYFRQKPDKVLLCAHEESTGRQLRWRFSPGAATYAVFDVMGKLKEQDKDAVPLRFSFTPLGFLHKVEQYDLEKDWQAVPPGHEDFWLEHPDKSFSSKISINGRAPAKAGNKYPRGQAKKEGGLK